MKKILSALLAPYHWVKEYFEYKKRIKKMRENDPYIYK
jgi:hypothetical protein